VQITTRFIEIVIANPGMQAWLVDEGEHAMRLLTRHETDFQPRLIHAIERLLTQEADAGRLDLPVDLPDLAYVIVRLIESYTYLDLITGQDPQSSACCCVSPDKTMLQRRSDTPRQDGSRAVRCETRTPVRGTRA
jgi:hypothetical protein